MHETLIKWSSLTKELGTWEDLVPLHQQFPYTPTRRHPDAQGEGDVTALQHAPARSTNSQPRRSTRAQKQFSTTEICHIRPHVCVMSVWSGPSLARLCSLVLSSSSNVLRIKRNRVDKRTKSIVASMSIVRVEIGIYPRVEQAH